MSKYKDLTGQKFGRLTVIKHAGRDNQRMALWECVCECGNRIITRGTSLRYGSPKSCGCLRIERTLEACTTHGLSGGRKNTTRLYRIWRNMKQRCYNPKASKYYLYGGRGIKVCSEWLNNYLVFYKWAISNGYKNNLTLDRIDSNGDYCPENCRWATYGQQARNTAQNHLITFRGKTQTLHEWASELGIKSRTLHSRLQDYGWSIEKAFTTPVEKRTKRNVTYMGITMSLSEWSNRLGISYKLLYKRIYLQGWSVEKAFNQLKKGA
jgi:hypothetical protein